MIANAAATIANAAAITIEVPGVMGSRIVTLRCPEEMLKRLNELAVQYNRSRNTLVVAALRLFSRQLREQQTKGAPQPMTPDMLTVEQLFPYPESRGGRPRRSGKKAPGV